ncbi:MAG: putative N-acetylmannosamine-6-phosphate 2-epimerase [Chloroflexi bacterium]|nr:putative N-acetylmannosamine-6-phosphate 2-epimerase [Chloroflexota bacterium]
MKPALRKLRGGLIVSCQADDDSPLHSPRAMALMAQAAALGGAVGTRVNGPADVRAVRKATRLPIIGIYKQRDPRWPVYITPTFAAARAVALAGADIIAIDAAHRARRGAVSPEELIRQIQRELRKPVMADVDSLAEGIAAAEAGADMLATTMAGYTGSRPRTEGPDLELLAELAARVRVPVICEGRVRNADDLRAAFAAGAFAVVVGNAITNPIAITQNFSNAAPRSMRRKPKGT